MSQLRADIRKRLAGLKSGLTTVEIAELLPKHDAAKVAKCVANMAAGGYLEKHAGRFGDGRRNTSRYTLNPEHAPAAPWRKPVKKRAYKRRGTPAAAGASAVQIGGDHYRSKAVQAWDAMAAWFTPDELRGFLKGNVIKYIARERDKGGAEDLRKARHYLDKLIEVAA